MSGKEIRTKSRRVLRLKLVDRQGLVCFYCRKVLVIVDGYQTQQQMRKKNAATIEHIRPISQGGTNDLSNLVLACAGCQEERHRAD